MGRKTLQIGEQMPSFTLHDQDGAEIASDSLTGDGPLVIFFYPADDTPGCTAEACGFRDQHQDFSEAGARVVGISRDSVASHADFVKKRNLPYTLLSDPDNHVRKAFGVPGGFMGLMPGRVTFVLDQGGALRAITESSFNPLKHVDQALDVVRELHQAQT